MVIHNGFICYLKNVGGGIDENGNPIRPTSELGEKIPCNIEINKEYNLGRDEGNTFTVASYKIFIDAKTDVSSLRDSRVRLTLHGRELGGFAVMYQPELLQAVGVYRIIV